MVNIYNNKKFLILIFGVFLFFFAGCTSDSTAREGRFGLDSFNGGNEGLVFTFDEGMPPQSIKDQGISPFNIRIKTENKGEFDVPEDSAHVRITGINPSDFNLDTVSRTFSSIFGVKKQGSSITPGGEQRVIFSNLRYNLQVSGALDFNINVNVCYPYQTRAVVMACFSDTIVMGNTDFLDCEIEGEKRFAHSGAPVKIENVRQMIGGQNAIQIQFDIVHSPSRNSRGSVFAPNSIDEMCNINGNSLDNFNVEKDTIHYTVDTRLDGLRCDGSDSNSGIAVLSGGRGTVFCTQDTSSVSGSYEVPIDIVLSYDYVDRISTPITVEHVRTN